MNTVLKYLEDLEKERETAVRLSSKSYSSEPAFAEFPPGQAASAILFDLRLPLCFSLNVPFLRHNFLLFAKQG